MSSPTEISPVSPQEAEKLRLFKPRKKPTRKPPTARELALEAERLRQAEEILHAMGESESGIAKVRFDGTYSFDQAEDWLSRFKYFIIGRLGIRLLSTIKPEGEKDEASRTNVYLKINID